MTIDQYDKFLRMDPEAREEQYRLMGVPTIKRKKLHFKSIEFFPVCIVKYFAPAICRVLSEEDEDYSGLMKAFQKFMDRINEILRDDPELNQTTLVIEDGLQRDIVQDFLQEINDYIIYGVHNMLFTSQ